MKDIVTWMNSILTDKLGMAASFADTIDVAIAVVMLIGTGLLCNWLCQILYKWITKHNGRLRRSKWYPFLSKRKLGSNLILLVPGVLIYSLIDLTFGSDPGLVSIMNRFAQAYITFAGIRICNSLMMAFLDFYSTTDKNRSHPLRGLVQGVQVLLFFIIPVKAWIFALFDLAITFLDVFRLTVAGMFPYNLFPLVAIANYLLFFGKDVLNLLPLSWRIKRRSASKNAGQKAQTIPFPSDHQTAPKPQQAYTHRCTICGRTDVSHPDLEFRYCSRCNGYHCYCIDHINNHEHVE